MIVDDTILEKPYSDENRVVAWRYDHTSRRSVKGVNIIKAIKTAFNELAVLKQQGGSMQRSVA